MVNKIALNLFQLAIFGYIPLRLCKKKINFFFTIYLFYFYLFFKNFSTKNLGIDLWYFFENFQKNKNLKFIKNGIDCNSKTNKHSNEFKKFPNFFLEKNIIYPNEKYTDFAGINQLIQKIQEYFEWPFRFFKIYQKIKKHSIKNVLFHGQPGTGKSFLSYVIAGELGIPIFILSSFFVSRINNFEEKKIEILLDCAKIYTPCIFFFDEIDEILKLKNQTPNPNEIDIKANIRLLILIDLIKKKNIFFFIIAATNQLETIGQSLRKAANFDREIKFNAPDSESRVSMLIHFTRKMKLRDCTNFDEIAKKTKGFVSGDLFTLIQTASILALFRLYAKTFKGNYRAKTLHIYFEFLVKTTDFERSFVKTNPILLRHGFSKIDVIRWNQLGALNSIRIILSRYIIQPIKTMDKSLKNSGILLYGPPGCGKTLIARIVAYESGANYINIKGPEIFDKFLGESEKNIRLIFDRALMGAPSILFFDEIDSILSKRSSVHISSQNNVSDRIVNQFLIEMDNIEKKGLIYVIGATNRPEMLDKAILRPGRIDKHLLVSFPYQKEKIQILITISKKISILPYVNFSYLSNIFPYKCSGADLMLLTKEAILNNSEIKLEYVLFKNTKEGLFSNSASFVSVENYLSGFRKR